MASSSSQIDSSSEDDETVEQAVARELGAVSDEDDVDDEDGEPTRCLFTDATAASPGAALQLDHSNYGFSLEEVCTRHRLKLYATIRLVNWIRRSVAAARSYVDDSQHADRAALVDHLARSGALNSQQLALPDALVRRLNDPANDELLRPVLPEDPLLGALSWCDDEDDNDDDDDEQRELEQRLRSLPDRLSAAGYDLDAVRSQPARIPHSIDD